MKKKVIFLFLFMLTILLVSSLEDCPYNKINDSYPGDCGNYIDENNDQICDYSQTINSQTSTQNLDDLIAGKDLKSKTIKEVAEIYQISPDNYAEKLSNYYKIKIKTTDTFQLLHDNYGVEPSVAKDIAISIKTGKEINLTETKTPERTYNLIPIALILILLYIISYTLSKKKIITLKQHRKFWNILLLLSFIMSGTLGILLVLKINFGLYFSLPFNILFWHVEIGIALFVICLIHIFEHWYYFKNIFK